MAFDGIMTWAISEELSQKLTLGKIEKIYQPESESLVFIIHTKDGRFRLYASASGNAPHICLTEREFENPQQPPIFCMILRKHIQGGRISRIAQNSSERIIEMDFQVLDELGFTVSKRLIFEIMGKHSNIILINLNDGRIIDSIKRVSIDVNRARQILPGLLYTYPPSQGKIGFKDFLGLSVDDEVSNHSDIDNAISVDWHDASDIMDKVGGISPRVADCISCSGFNILKDISCQIESMSAETKIYSNGKKLTDFHIVSMDRILSQVKSFDSPTAAVDYFFAHKKETNLMQQAESNLLKKINSIRDKLGLKLQRMEEDVLKAKQSENLRLHGELLTANIHNIKKGDLMAHIVNYYDGNVVDIKLDPKLSPSENAQKYYKKYGKAMNTIKEKQPMIESVKSEISYIDSVIDHLSRAADIKQIEYIRDELIDEGYLKRRSIGKNNRKSNKNKSKAEKNSVSNGKINNPLIFNLNSGRRIIVGRNNKENDVLTLRMASKSDIWFHTKDIPGSHVILQTGGITLSEMETKFPDEIKTAAGIAAYHSKGKSSENVPVDYTEVRYVKKPSGAKPGMVIFKNNKTVWITPEIPSRP